MNEQQPELWIITRGEYDDTRQVCIVAGTREQVAARVADLEHARLNPQPEHEGWEAPAVEVDPWDFEALPPYIGHITDVEITQNGAPVPTGAQIGA